VIEVEYTECLDVRILIPIQRVLIQARIAKHALQIEDDGIPRWIQSLHKSHGTGTHPRVIGSQNVQLGVVDRVYIDAIDGRGIGKVSTCIAGDIASADDLAGFIELLRSNRGQVIWAREQSWSFLAVVCVGNCGPDDLLGPLSQSYPGQREDGGEEGCHGRRVIVDSRKKL
jgi:hypothetical protein